jgi:murein DD-endopeptidase MepM/ murein hydrolase activator NlpD
MQRLVYTPRVYVFTKDAQGNIRDISRYITAGDVSRKLGQVSTATVTLRNPKRIFTTPDVDGLTAFNPMDPITIYMKRLRDRPVRVFTGFLDKTPYWQMYPGTVTLRASCTLKRLLYTYFDPALPYTQSFLAAYGWIPDPKNPGQWFSFNGLNDWQKIQSEDVAEYQKLSGQRIPEDGSLAQLIYATLKHIGNWSDPDIYIESLPKDLFARLAELAKQFDADADATRQEFNELMRRIIGEGSYGDGNLDLSGIDGTVTEKVYKVGREMRVPYKHLLAAFMTGLVETHFHNLPGGDADSAGWRQERASLYPDPTNITHSAERFYRECQQLDHGQSAGELAADVQRPREDLRGRYADVRDQAVSLLRKTKRQVEGDDFAASGTPGQALDPDRTKRSTHMGGTTKGGRGDKLFSPIRHLSPSGWPGPGGAYGAARNYGGHAGVDMPAAMGTNLYAIGAGEVVYAGDWGGEGKLVMIKLSTPVDNYPRNIRIGYGHMSALGVSKGDQVQGGNYIGKSGAGSNGQPHLHFFVRTDNTPANGTMDPTPLAKAAAKGEQPSGGPGSSGPDSTGGSNSRLGAAAAATFFASINFPSMMESLEAEALGGEKSLMNDKPLLPFVQQLCEAGLREFQSMPDGKFFAFYPDYFGEMNHRAPYWEIDDIEVLDGKIELSDDALVTHMYVVGDTTFSGNDILNSMFSSGVVTIFNAFLADSMLNRKPVKDDTAKKDGPKPIQGKDDTRGMEFVMKKDDAIAFLQRYGARPMVDSMPMIKHPYFEMFLAYQRFLLAWSKQFLTTFTFTFMPELYPGGKVGFPDHGLQMYIDEVTHSWDYTSGFTTMANLSAPSVYGKTDQQLPPNMVKALVTPGLPEHQAKQQKVK